MFERKLIRHPYGHEEVLIVDGAVLRQHDLPLTGLTTFLLTMRMFGPWPDLAVLFQELIAEKKQVTATEAVRLQESRSNWRGVPVPSAV